MIDLSTLTIAWLVLPLLVAFGIYLFPRVDRPFATLAALVSIIYGGSAIARAEPLTLTLLNNFGVSLLVDSLSGFFILTNGFVTAAVILYCWGSDRKTFFYTQLMVLHGSINSIFLCTDLMSVYVALEVISIAAFSLIAYPRSDRAIWIALRYLFVSNTAMLFYLIGAVLVYKANASFHFEGIQNAPPEAIALILLGLLVKGGVFISGLWLPLTHGEAATPVSAMLSGVVVKAGLFPLVRCALLVPDLDPLIRLLGVATALLGVSYAILERDSKRLLAYSTISQVGFVLAAPPVAGFYALSHGLAKAALFLGVGSLPSRDFRQLRTLNLAPWLGGAIAIAALSICGAPPLGGFGAKTLTLDSLLPWQVIPLNVAAVGTVIALSKLIFLPWNPYFAALKLPFQGSSNPSINADNSSHSGDLGKRLGDSSPDTAETAAVATATPTAGLWLALPFLLGGLAIANGFYPQAYGLSSFLKLAITLGIGWGIYGLLPRSLPVQLPRTVENLDHLIGAMSLGLVILFWMVMP
ncbi:MAG: cation:proton antiporter [Cyanophyceae cyanobacterium]